ncbi:MAG TPA: polysaccharide biosynthesis protein [Fimbriiglobus sp.]|jgi:spore coat polysaccharide biosynthesis predicted glycosyltransferase SpsG
MDVKRGPVLFRCDGTPSAGFEPFYQCLAFAAALQRRRRGTHFFSYLEPLSLAPVVTRGNNAWAPAEQPMGTPGDIEATLREIRRLDAAAVVVAGPDVSEKYLRNIRDTGTLVIAVDSSAGIKFPTDLVVNPYFTPGPKAFKFDTGAQLLLGRKFALVRGLFRRQRTIRATEQPGPFRALVAFGDDDFGDQTLLRTRQLLTIPGVDKVSMIVRTHHDRYEELKDFADENGSRVEIVTEAKEIMTRLVRGHFALTGGDTWSLELCCVGIPQLTIAGSPRHSMNAKRMDDLGVATFLGSAADVKESDLAEAVGVVLTDPIERQGMSRCARKMIDGRGGDRIVNGMEIMLRAPARAIPAYRLAA